MMIRRALVAVVAACVNASCAPELNWRDVRSDEVGARLLFPCRPVRQQREISLGGSNRIMVLQACNAAGTSWALALVQVRTAQEREPIEQELSRAIRANMDAGTFTAEEAQQSYGRVGASPIRHWRGRAPDGRAIEAVTSFVYRPGWLVQVTAVGPVVARDDALTFVGSLRFDS